jgi:hypothetical protein
MSIEAMSRSSLLAPSRIAVVTVAVLLMLTGGARAQLPPSLTECLDAHAEGQRAERRAELHSAAARYGQCAAPHCPDAVRHDCDEWRSRVAQAMPTIVVRPRDARGASISARVWIDDVPIPAAEAGLPVSLDPGRHNFRLEAPGFPPTEQSVWVVMHEKDRVVDLQLRAREGNPPPAAPPVRHSQTPWPWILAGVGVVGVGTFLGVAVDAKARYDELDRACSPRCDSGDVDGIRRSYVIADVALALGGASLVASAVWFVARSLGRKSASARAPSFWF